MTSRSGLRLEQIIKFILSQKISRDETLLALAIAAHWSPIHAEIFPQTSTLVVQTKMSRSSLLRAKAKLKKRGILKFINRMKPGATREHESTRYVLTEWKVWKWWRDQGYKGFDPQVESPGSSKQPVVKAKEPFHPDFFP